MMKTQKVNMTSREIAPINPALAGQVWILLKLLQAYVAKCGGQPKHDLEIHIIVFVDSLAVFRRLSATII